MTRVSRWCLAICAALVAAGLALAPVAGQAPTPPVAAPTVPGEAVAAIARDLNCPLCQGYSLQDCPLTVCAQMRDLIRQKLAAGETREAIVASFVAEYGPEVLNAPPTGGVFLTAWVLPGLALALAALVLAVWLRRRVVAPASGPVTPAAAPDLVARLERLVDEREDPA